MPQPELLAGRAGPDTGLTYLTDSLTENRRAVFSTRRRRRRTGSRFSSTSVISRSTAPSRPSRPTSPISRRSQRAAGTATKNAVYAAMIRGLDDSVGRILDTLARTGLAENTLVVFMSDNGGRDLQQPAGHQQRAAQGRQGDDVRGRHPRAARVSLAGESRRRPVVARCRWITRIFFPHAAALRPLRSGAALRAHRRPQPRAVARRSDERPPRFTRATRITGTIRSTSASPATPWTICRPRRTRRFAKVISS